MNRRSIVALCVVLTACGGSALPPAKMAEAQSEISAAAAVGAERHPAAALHLKMARDQLKDAQQLANRGEGERAKLVLDRASADAQLALVLTREAEANAELAKARTQLGNLQQANR